MKLIEGIAVFVAIVLLALHLVLQKHKKTRIIICVCIAAGLCLTKTMHGIMSAILLIAGEVIINKFNK